MSVEIEITGGGRYAGAKSNVSSYTISEESTPIAIGDTTGATGQVSFTAVDDPSREGSVLLYNSDIRLTDGDRGFTTATIKNISSNSGILSITADSYLNKLVGDVTAAYIEDTLDNIVYYYATLAGVEEFVVVDDSLASITLTVPGWSGDLWTKMKELAVIVGAEITLLRGNILFRPLRTNDAMEFNNVSTSWTVQPGEMAQYIEIYYYNTVIKTGALVYPITKENEEEDTNIISVDAGEVLESNIPVDVTLASLVQPVPMDYIAPGDYSNSAYTVCGNDGLPIPAQQWIDHGGEVTVSIGEDGKSIDLRVVGADGASAKYAPFRLAVSSGSGNYYNTLRILGTGAAYDKKLLTIPTGAGIEDTTNVTGVTIDSPFIRTREQAFELALNEAGRWCAPQRTISMSKVSIAKPNDTVKSYEYATFADFDAEYSGDTFGDFDTAWAGQTFEDFDNYWAAKVADLFEFQAFGNIAGARLQYRRNHYRIRSASITESSVDFSAEVDTTFADFDAAAEGMTFADFDAAFDGMTFSEFALIPLIEVAPSYDTE